MAGQQMHFEPYIYLAEVTDRSALITWGGFFFWISAEHPVDGNDWLLVDDERLATLKGFGTIGARSKSYDTTREGARVEVRDAATNEVVTDIRAPGVNHCWVSNLEPDTEYVYKIFVNGLEWAGGELRDWVDKDGFKGLKKNGGRYKNIFKTRPHVEGPADLTFAVLGDYGRGMHEPLSDESRQGEVAKALQKAIDGEDGIRLILTTGDNIYNHGAGDAGGSGGEDDDWFFTFYQPYRYIINRIPVYPTCGNHDSAESERSDDRKQLNDNFYVEQRFSGLQGLASIDPGLFYRVRYGSNIEFIAIDTSKNSIWPWADRNFEHPNHQAFLRSAFPATGAGDRVWRIPFGHHPPFCAGPLHKNSDSVKEKIVENLCMKAGVRVFFSGHEHNFQYTSDRGIEFFVTGGGGDIRLGIPSQTNFKKARTKAWGRGGHFLVVKIEGNEMTVRPVGELAGGALADLKVFTPANAPFVTPINIRK